jgi:hypothetical protein
MNTTQASGLRPASKLLVNGIVAATSTVVQAGLRGDWGRALAMADHRRNLLARLETESCGAGGSCIEALRQAVRESERALAVIGATRWQQSRV